VWIGDWWGFKEKLGGKFCHPRLTTTRKTRGRAGRVPPSGIKAKPKEKKQYDGQDKTQKKTKE